MKIVTFLLCVVSLCVVLGLLFKNDLNKLGESYVTEDSMNGTVQGPQWDSNPEKPAVREVAEWSGYDVSQLSSLIRSGDKSNYRQLKYSFEKMYEEDREGALALLDELLVVMADEKEYELTLAFLSYLDTAEEIPEKERSFFLEWATGSEEQVWSKLATWRSEGSYSPSHQFAMLASIYQNEKREGLQRLMSWANSVEDPGVLAVLAPALAQQVTTETQGQVQSFLADRFEHENARIGALELAANCSEEGLAQALEWGHALPQGSDDAAQFLEIGISRITKVDPELAVELINSEEFITQYAGADKYLDFSDHIIVTYIREILHVDPENAKLALEGISSASLQEEYGEMVENIIKYKERTTPQK